MAKRRRTKIALIADPAARLVTFSKTRKGLFNKASELCRLCGARVAVVVFSPAGKPFSFGDPSADDILSDYLGDDNLMLPMDLTEWEKWVEEELDACATEEELKQFISKYEAVRDFARQKLEALEKEEEDDSQVRVGGVGDSEVPTEEEIEAIFESLAWCLTLPDLNDVDHHSVMISPENSSAGDLKGCGSLGMASTPAFSDIKDFGFDPDELRALLDDCVEDGDGDGFLNPPEDSAIGGGNSGAEAMCSDQEAYEYYNPNDFADLEDLDVQL